MLSLAIGERRTRVRGCHNLPMSLTGAGLLWAGWLSLASGCALNDTTAAMAVLCTQVRCYHTAQLLPNCPAATKLLSCYQTVQLLPHCPAATTLSS